MQVADQAMRVCIYLTTTDRYQGRSLYQAVVAKAKALGIARVTVSKGCLGYGDSGRWHAERTWRLMQEVPVMIEVLDREPRLRPLLHCLDDLCGDGLVTVEPVAAAEFWKPAPPAVPVGWSLPAMLKWLLACCKRRLCIIYIPGSC